MIKIKHAGFTLPEVLITLTVIGIVAIMVIPGFLHDMNNKANMALLQSTVGNLTSAVQNELVRTGASDLKNTYIQLDLEKFLQTLDVSKIGDAHIFPLNIYKNMNGDTFKGTACHKAAILKNGVSICITGHWSNSEEDIEGYWAYIDLNGQKGPNISGVDFWGLNIYSKSNTKLGIRVGDVGGLPQTDEITPEMCKEANTGRKPVAYCYTLVERSGFDPNYINSYVPPTEEGN